MTPMPTAKINVSDRKIDSSLFSDIERDLIGFEVEIVGEVIQIMSILDFSGDYRNKSVN